MEKVLLSTEGLLPFKLYTKGKVRDIYDLGDTLLMVATDRISAFDVVLPTGIPYKGKVLNGLSAFWFQKTKSIIGSHFITANVDEYPPECQQYKDILDGRSMLVKKAHRIDVEAVVRAYLAGSGWKAYQETGKICGVKLPEGLRESSKLAKPIFTPATKSDSGHDQNISFEEMIDFLIRWRWAPEQKGIAFNYANARSLAEIICSKSIKLLVFAAAWAEKNGVIIADTKFEYGLIDGNLVLIDEALTPDSSRFWPLDDYEPGRSQKSFDKQFVRDYLEGINWDKNPPAPELPPEVVTKTSEKYLEAYRRLTGTDLV